ncbi:MAG: hypothetical protein CV089_11460 [Nitrospira sp. WS110]|nr:hypothetical protein [Nitrospira sp. WS110]
MEGRYANYAQVGYNAAEFVLDFGQLHPPTDTPHFHIRIITTPVYAKAFLETLLVSLQRYEEEYGEIADRLHHDNRMSDG